MRVGERVWDSEIGGFYARRGKHGVAFRVMADLPTKVVKQRLNGGRTLERTIGRFGTLPGEVTAKAARTQARHMISLIKKGVDPDGSATSVDGPTLAVAWEEYKTDYMVKRGRSEKTIRFYEACYKRLNWHDKLLTVIASDPKALKDEHARLTKVHRRKGKNALKDEHAGKSAADSTMEFLGRIYDHARGTYPGLPEWPRKAVVKHGPSRRKQGRIGSAELAAWWGETEKLEPIKREFVRFLLFSGLRATDAMTASWANVDEAKGTLFVPKPKGHRDDRSRAFTLHLTAPMLAGLRAARDAWLEEGHESSPWLFPSIRAAEGHLADSRAQYTDDDGNVRQVKTGHDLRRSFSDIAKTAGVPEEVVGVLMNHKPRTITGSYHDPNATPDFYRAAMERISAKIMEVVGR